MVINTGMDITIKSAVFDYSKYESAVDVFCYLKEQGFDYDTALSVAVGDELSSRALERLLREKADNGEIDDEFVDKKPARKKSKKKPNPEFLDKDLDDDGRDDVTGKYVQDQDGKDIRYGNKPVYAQDETEKSSDPPEGTDKLGDGQSKPKLVKDRKPLSKDANKVPLGKTVVLLNPREREEDQAKIYEFWKKGIALNRVRNRSN